MKPEEIVRWAFYGYVTPAGRREVQDWFNALTDPEKDEIRDVLMYLQPLPLRLWGKPEYEMLGDGLSEIRVKVGALNKTIRIYGCFWPERQRCSYTFLLGKEKKVKNDEGGKKDARKRKGALGRGEATVHEFEFS
jgi:hypothetical protein